MEQTQFQIEVKGSDLKKTPNAPIYGKMVLWDQGIFLALVISVAIHGVILFSARGVEQKEEGQMSASIDRIPERVARLIMDKPRHKEVPKTVQKVRKGSLDEKIAKEKNPMVRKELESKRSEIRKQAAKISVAKRAQNVQQKLRNEGILAMLTGVGKTKSAMLPVVDVLKETGSVRFGDLDQKLKVAGNLVEARDIEQTRSRLASKELVESQAAIDIRARIQSLQGGAVLSLEKLGNITITKPTRLEGAAIGTAKRDEGSLNAVVQKHRVSIHSSYKRLLIQSPGLGGKITFRFTILPNGNVEDVEIIENTTGNDELAGEIARKIERWRFPEIPEEQGTLRLSYPFVFQPG